MRRFVLALTLVLACLAVALVFALLRDTRLVALEDTVDTVIRPTYIAFRDAAAEQATAWRSFCKAPDDAGFQTLRDRYMGTADAWSAAEIIPFGASSGDFRVERISYWPERRNATTKGLAALLAKSGTDDLTPDGIREMSVAVQGLPAIERLLFDVDASVEAFAGRTEKGQRRCAVGTAVAANVAILADEIAKIWEAYEIRDGENLSIRIATDLLMSFDNITRTKLKPVLGEDIGKARPQVAEGWRSGRMARAIVINLESGGRLFRALASRSDVSELTFPGHLDTALRLSKAMPPDAHLWAADAKRRRDLVLLDDEVASASHSLRDELPRILGVTLGFNSNDGD